jgi:hypothetical protein
MEMRLEGAAWPARHSTDDGTTSGNAQTPAAAAEETRNRRREVRSDAVARMISLQRKSADRASPARRCSNSAASRPAGIIVRMPELSTGR